jgi:hypothetical protein
VNEGRDARTEVSAQCHRSRERIMKSGDGLVQGYNCQAAVDAELQIIVAQAVTNQPADGVRSRLTNERQAQ